MTQISLNSSLYPMQSPSGSPPKPVSNKESYFSYKPYTPVTTSVTDLINQIYKNYGWIKGNQSYTQAPSVSSYSPTEMTWKEGKAVNMQTEGCQKCYITLNNLVEEKTKEIYTELYGHNANASQTKEFQEIKLSIVENF